MKRNNKLSKWIANKINAQPGRCWTNSFNALMELGEGTYVEGWAVPLDLMIPFEHGWLEINDRIVDPTEVMLKSETKYFPGKKYSFDEVLTAVNSGIDLPIAWTHSWGGFRDGDYKAANDAAYQFCIIGD